MGEAIYGQGTLAVLQFYIPCVIYRSNNIWFTSKVRANIPCTGSFWFDREAGSTQGWPETEKVELPTRAPKRLRSVCCSLAGLVAKLRNEQQPKATLTSFSSRKDLTLTYFKQGQLHTAALQHRRLCWLHTRRDDLVFDSLQLPVTHHNRIAVHAACLCPIPRLFCCTNASWTGECSNLEVHQILSCDFDQKRRRTRIYAST